MDETGSRSTAAAVDADPCAHLPDVERPQLLYWVAPALGAAVDDGLLDEETVQVFLEVCGGADAGAVAAAVFVVLPDVLRADRGALDLDRLTTRIDRELDYFERLPIRPRNLLEPGPGAEYLADLAGLPRPPAPVGRAVFYPIVGPRPARTSASPGAAGPAPTPASSAPVGPAPAAPEPVGPPPATPQSATPESATPESATPASAAVENRRMADGPAGAASRVGHRCLTRGDHSHAVDGYESAPGPSRTMTFELPLHGTARSAGGVELVGPPPGVDGAVRSGARDTCGAPDPVLDLPAPGQKGDLRAGDDRRTRRSRRRSRVVREPTVPPPTDDRPSGRARRHRIPVVSRGVRNIRTPFAPRPPRTSRGPPTPAAFSLRLTAGLQPTSAARPPAITHGLRSRSPPRSRCAVARGQAPGGSQRERARSTDPVSGAPH